MSVREPDKTSCMWKKDYIWNLSTCACETNNYLKIIDDD